MISRTKNVQNFFHYCANFNLRAKIVYNQHSHIIFTEPRLMSIKRGHPFTLSDIRSPRAQHFGSEPTTRFQRCTAEPGSLCKLSPDSTWSSAVSRTVLFIKDPVYCPLGRLTLCWTWPYMRAAQFDATKLAVEQWYYCMQMVNDT